MEDVTPKLLEQIRKVFDEKFNKSDLISKLYAKVRDGTATYIEANEFAIEVGEILAQAYGKCLSSDVLPDGKMYYNIAKRIIEPTMKNNHSLITDVTSRVQKSLNESAGIGIKPIVPEVDQDRINGIINRVSSESVFDEVKWILDEPVKLFSQSIVDDAIRKNAEFQYRSGMTPKIIRKVAGSCCEWCGEVAGAYKYPDVPKDVYRRHQRCRCTVEYYPGNGKVQNVHTKKLENKEITLDADYMGKPQIHEINLNGKKYDIKTYKNDNYENIWCQTYSTDSQKMCEYLNHVVNSKYPGVERIIVAKKSTLQGIAAYEYSTKSFFICEELIAEKNFSKIVDTDFFAAQSLDDVLIHELGGHKRHWEAVERYYNKNSNRLRSISEAKQELEVELRRYIKMQISNNRHYLVEYVSENASEQFSVKKVLNECIADATILMERKTLKDGYLKALIEEVIFYDGDAK